MKIFLLLSVMPAFVGFLVQAANKKNDVSETKSLGESAAVQFDEEDSSSSSGEENVKFHAEKVNLQTSSFERIPIYQIEEKVAANFQTKILPLKHEKSHHEKTTVPNTSIQNALDSREDSSSQSEETSPIATANHNRANYYGSASTQRIFSTNHQQPNSPELAKKSEQQKEKNSKNITIKKQQPENYFDGPKKDIAPQIISELAVLELKQHECQLSSQRGGIDLVSQYEAEFEREQSRFKSKGFNYDFAIKENDAFKAGKKKKDIFSLGNQASNHLARKIENEYSSSSSTCNNIFLNNGDDVEEEATLVEEQSNQPQRPSKYTQYSGEKSFKDNYADQISSSKSQFSTICNSASKKALEHKRQNGLGENSHKQQTTAPKFEHEFQQTTTPKFEHEFQQMSSLNSKSSRMNSTAYSSCRISLAPHDPEWKFLATTKHIELFSPMERKSIIQMANMKFPGIFPESCITSIKFRYASSLWIPNLNAHVTVVRVWKRGGNSLLYATLHDNQWRQMLSREGRGSEEPFQVGSVTLPSFLPIPYKLKPHVSGGECVTRGPSDPRIFINEFGQLCVSFSMLITKIMTRMCLFNFHHATFKCFFSPLFPDFQPQKNWSPIVFSKKTWFLYDYHRFKLVDTQDNQNVSFVFDGSDSLFFSELRGGSSFQSLGNDLYLGFATVKSASQGRKRPRLVLVYIPAGKPEKAHVIRMSGPLEFKVENVEDKLFSSEANIREIIVSGIPKINKKTDSISVNVTIEKKAVFVFEVCGIGEFLSVPKANGKPNSKSPAFLQEIQELRTCSQIAKPAIQGKAYPMNVHNLRWGSCQALAPFADYDFYLAALPAVYMRNGMKDGFLCGKHYWVEVSNLRNGKSIKVKIADTCEEGFEKPNDLRLSQKAYAKLGGKYSTTNGAENSWIDVAWRIIYE